MVRAVSMRTSTRPATLEPVRFGEFLLDRHLISDEQWLAALAAHWSGMVGRSPQSPARHKRIGAQIAADGYLPVEIIESEARAFHDGSGLDVVEIDAGLAEAEAQARLPRSERNTLPVPQVHFVPPPI